MTKNDTEAKKSKVELIKETSDALRGSIAAELADSSTDHVEDATTKLLKFHGTYQQDDRDLRKSRRSAGLGKAFSFMVRNRIPGGKLSAAQFIGELDIADELGNGTLRITTRQSIQLHGVIKDNLWPTIHRINAIKLSTQSACGDVTRNVCCCPAPLDHLREELQALTDEIAEHVRPKSKAYHEIWINDIETGERQRVEPPSDVEHEPLYGKAYMPRKFKIGIGLCDDNCTDVYSHDLGILVVTDQSEIRGFNVLVGGSMGTTPSKEQCFPAIGKKLTFVKREELLSVITAVMLVQRDFGDRGDRSQARLKYLIHRWGLHAFKAKVEQYLPQAERLCNVAEGTVRRPLPDPHPADVTHHEDHLGWHQQADGRWFLGLPIEDGRVKDDGKERLKSALRHLFTQEVPTARLTLQQNILLCDIEESRRDTIEQILSEHGVRTLRDTSNARRFAMACPALPTCGLAVTESERVLPNVIAELEPTLKQLDLQNERFAIHMTGCPNGCARPYNCDIGLVGRSVDGKTGEGKYTIFVGGSLLGNRMNRIYKDMVRQSDIVHELRPLLASFRDNREANESLGDFLNRWETSSKHVPKEIERPAR